MTMLNHFEAVTYLRKAPSIVTLRVYRDPNAQKSEICTEDIKSKWDENQVKFYYIAFSTQINGIIREYLST